MISITWQCDSTMNSPKLKGAHFYRDIFDVPSILKKTSSTQSFMREGSEPIERRLELNEESLARYGFPSSVVGTNYAPLSMSFTWRIVSGDNKNNLLLFRKNFMGESCNSDNYQEAADPRNVGKAVFISE